MITEKLETELYKVFEEHNSNSNEHLEPDSIVSLVESIKYILNKNSDIGMVEEFMKMTNQIVREKPTIPPVNECLFRLSLINEETIELAEACGSEVLNQFGLMLYKRSEEIRYKVEEKRENLQPNLIACLDAFKDLQYVSRGSELSFGMKFIDAESFEEVHDSNMSKICENIDIATLTCDSYTKKDIHTTLEIKENGSVLILRIPDKKVLKSINYKPANLNKFIFNTL